MDSHHSSTSDTMDAIDGVEFTHVHHSPSMPGSSSDPPSAPPSISPTPPMSTNHSNSSPTAPSGSLRKDALKAASTGQQLMTSADHPPLFTIPSADMTTSRYQEQAELEQVLDCDAKASSGTLTMQSGFGNSAYNNLDTQTREINATLEGMAAVQTVSHHISVSQTYMGGERDLGAAHHAPDSQRRRDDHDTNTLAESQTKQPTYLRGRSAQFLAQMRSAEERNTLETSGRRTMASLNTPTHNALRDLMCTESRLTPLDAANTDTMGSHGNTADINFRPDAAAIRAVHDGEHVSFQGNVEVQKPMQLENAAPGRGQAHDNASAFAMEHKLPSAAAGIGLKDEFPEVQDILRSTKRHPSELQDTRPGTSTALMTTEELIVGTGGELSNSQECNQTLECSHIVAVNLISLALC